MSTRRPSGSSYGATRPGYVASPPAHPAQPHHQTLRLPNAPPIPGRSKYPPPAIDGRAAAKQEPTIDVEYVEQAGGEAFDGGSWTLFEIWTRNRIYHVDASFTCTAVVTRATGRAESAHPLKGARLTGGERRSKTSHLVDICFPLPSPGTEAVFRSDAKKHGQFAKTSTIERVVLRVRRVRVNTSAEGQAWEDIVGRSRLR
jgi:hypothetical protein